MASFLSTIRGTGQSHLQVREENYPEGKHLRSVATRDLPSKEKTCVSQRCCPTDKHRSPANSREGYLHMRHFSWYCAPPFTPGLFLWLPISSADC